MENSFVIPSSVSPKKFNRFSEYLTYQWLSVHFNTIWSRI